MAEAGGDKSTRSLHAFGKRVLRTKEKVMQKIGKADRTTDSEFDHIVNQFNEQQDVANLLQKEFKNYAIQVKAMSIASQSMYHAIRDSYEFTWNNADKFVPASEKLTAIWDDYIMKLNDDVQVPITDYANKFRDLKVKIAKRGRKLTDYDSARHSVESLEGAKKRDEAKINKAHEELLMSKTIYESINNELSEELPTLYHSRVSTLCNYFSQLFQLEASFQAECSKVKNELAMYVELKNVDVSARVPSQKPPLVQRDVEERNKVSSYDKDVEEPQANVYLTLIDVGNENGQYRIASESSDDEAGNDKVNNMPMPSTDTTSAKRLSASSGSAKVAPDKKSNPRSSSSSHSSTECLPKNTFPADRLMETQLVEGSEVKEKTNGQDDTVDSVDNGRLDAKRMSSTTESTSHDKFLYKAIAIHSYNAEDPDELTFEKGDIIGVIPLELNEEEQDEGWLCGIKISTGEKGVFPANFTNPM